MPHQIKRLDDGELFDVTVRPVLVNGVWECGDRRFTDADGTLYEPVALADPLPLLDPMDFYLAFTPLERIAIKTSADPIVKEFWETYQLAVDNKAHVNPNLVSVQNGLAYLATPTDAAPTPGAGILASFDRVSQILAGTPQ